MSKPKEIPISEEDLKFMVADEFEQIIDLARFHSFCFKCKREKKVEMIEYKILLNDLNDVSFEGKCKSCDSKIARYIETGERPEFWQNAELIRERK